MRLTIVGQKWIAAELLEQCVVEGHEVVAAIAPAANDRLALVGHRLGIPTVVSRRVEPDAIPQSTDLILAAHAHAFISATARRRARLGALGYHPSLLPRHRGRDAIRWAIHMREAVTGGTLYWLDDGADTGPIALQDWAHVRPGDTPAELWRRTLAPMGLRLFREALARVERGNCPRIEQDTELATWEPAFRSSLLGDQ
ncbi:methionyl-tRNA formyltransferase [Burkholderia sp. Ac-20345]|uniref:formyltransferase family protein n=1 Tax=Burkholderia sp. Ac-20345 TaxID=2703891 RepID=UPI00197B4458|nr:formyltransferase family protein [Burkholderia sp. Ac-20345]MBN3779903.1 methionyl-tRNA formyltransferase [Burkholderia sp. Ac-20345]